MLLRNANKLLAVAVWDYFFVGEMVQKQAIWYLNHKSLNINLLFIELLYKINFTIILIFEQKTVLFVILTKWKDIYTHFLPPYLEFCDHS